MDTIKELTYNLLGIEIIYIRRQEAHGPYRSLEKPVQINKYVLIDLNWFLWRAISCRLM